MRQILGPKFCTRQAFEGGGEWAMWGGVFNRPTPQLILIELLLLLLIPYTHSVMNELGKE